RCPAVVPSRSRLAGGHLFVDWHAVRRDVHSFPTRRSSDLAGGRENEREDEEREGGATEGVGPAEPGEHGEEEGEDVENGRGVERSEEHTSELQSRENLVCRLLLEKKKSNTPSSEHDDSRHP